MFGATDTVQYDQIGEMVMLLAGFKEPSVPSDKCVRQVPLSGGMGGCCRAQNFFLRPSLTGSPAARGAVVQAILEALGIPLKPCDHPFTDLPNDDPYASALATGYALGLVTGYTNADGVL